MFHKCYLLPSFKDIASFCFMHSLKILLLLLWVRSGCVFPLPFCMHAAQTGRSVQCVIRVESVRHAAMWDSGKDPAWAHRPGRRSGGGRPAARRGTGRAGSRELVGAGGSVLCPCPLFPANARWRFTMRPTGDPKSSL